MMITHGFQETWPKCSKLVTHSGPSETPFTDARSLVHVWNEMLNETYTVANSAGIPQ